MCVGSAHKKKSNKIRVIIEKKTNNKTKKFYRKKQNMWPLKREESERWLVKLSAIQTFTEQDTEFLLFSSGALAVMLFRLLFFFFFVFFVLNLFLFVFISISCFVLPELGFPVPAWRRWRSSLRVSAVPSPACAYAGS